MDTNFENSNLGYKQPVNLTAIYVLAILAILLSYCCSPVGLILAIIAFVMVYNKMNAYKLNPSMFIGGENIKTAQIVVYVALAINVLLLIYTIYSLATGGFEKIMEAFEQGMQAAEKYD